MSRDTPIITTVRAARFSSAAHDEVELRYPLETVPGHQDNGKQQLAFYPTDLYAKRAKRHGRKYYPRPEPYTDGKFKR